MDSFTSNSNLREINKGCFKGCFRIYMKTISLVITPIILLPISFLGDNNAYLSFYVFLVTATLLMGDFLHPGVISLVPIALFFIIGIFKKKLIFTIAISNSTLDCFGVMVLIVAVESCHINRRVALKILLTFGCSHFRLSFILFFTTMLLSMWFTNCMACGLMMPVVKAIMKELEKVRIMLNYFMMGILDTCDILGNVTNRSTHYDNNIQKPSDFTIFYFMGIAYSSTIGGMATFIGSETNQNFVNYCATKFPGEFKLEFPHYLLLTLPGVLLMEMVLYLWLNFYYLGMLRVQNYTALQASLTSEEEQFITVLLKGQYQQMGKIKFQEMIVGALVVMAAILQATVVSYQDTDNLNARRVVNVSIPCILILFLAPIKLDCINYFRKERDTSKPLPTCPNRGCLTWDTLQNNIPWSVLFITASADITFDSLKDSKMTDEFEKFLLLFEKWPQPAVAFVVIIFCKILTEFASNMTVARSLIPHVANVGLKSKINPFYLMLCANLSSSLPFHLITGTPAYALVAAYVHIPPKKMMIAGIGLSVTAILTNTLTVCVWSKVIWPDIDKYPNWAEGIYPTNIMTVLTLTSLHGTKNCKNKEESRHKLSSKQEGLYLVN